MLHPKWVWLFLGYSEEVIKKLSITAGIKKEEDSSMTDQSYISDKSLPKKRVKALKKTSDLVKLA